MEFILGKRQVGERVSLKPDVPETRCDGECAMTPRTTGTLANPTIKPGDPSACWHKPCRIVRACEDGGFLIENTDGFVRQADPDMLLKDYS